VEKMPSFFKLRVVSGKKLDRVYILGFMVLKVKKELFKIARSKKKYEYFILLN